MPFYRELNCLAFFYSIGQWHISLVSDSFLQYTVFYVQTPCYLSFSYLMLLTDRTGIKICILNYNLRTNHWKTSASYVTERKTIFVCPFWQFTFFSFANYSCVLLIAADEDTVVIVIMTWYVNTHKIMALILNSKLAFSCKIRSERLHQCYSTVDPRTGTGPKNILPVRISLVPNLFFLKTVAEGDSRIKKSVSDKEHQSHWSYLI
jgi:hypothetical protein